RRSHPSWRVVRGVIRSEKARQMHFQRNSKFAADWLAERGGFSLSPYTRTPMKPAHCEFSRCLFGFQAHSSLRLVSIQSTQFPAFPLETVSLVSVTIG